MKVLIGVDGSQGSFRAVKQVGRFLQAPLDGVVLYCSPPEVRGATVDDAMREKARQAIARAIFDEARTHLPEALRPGVAEIVGAQNPGHGLVVAATECGAELIAVGARGLGPLAAMLVGSVSREVVHAARIPVLVVRPSPFDDDELRVLAAYDGSNACRRALEAATRFAWPESTQAVLLSVIEPMLAAELPDWLAQHVHRDPETEAMAQAWQREHERERQQRQAELAALAGQLPPPFRNARTEVLEGNPDEQILAACNKERIDVVVVGTRVHGALERLLVGSTTERILAHAPCSVLIAREREKP